MILSILNHFRFSSFLVHCASSGVADTVDPKEVSFYNRHAAEWWDTKGQFVPLFQFNHIRIPFIETQILKTNLNNRALTRSIETISTSPLQGLCILDVGCGGGFLAEPLAEKGAVVVGIDVSEECVKVAETHRQQTLCSLTPNSHAYNSLKKLQYLHIDVKTLRDYIIKGLLNVDDEGYLQQVVTQSKTSSTSAAEDSLVKSADVTPSSPDTSHSNTNKFDVVVTSEVIEHVKSPEAFFGYCADCVKPGGILILTTPNRTPLSYLFVIFFAEYVLKLIPKGTHFYSNFLTPSEITTMAKSHGFKLLEATGTIYIPFFERWYTEPTKAVAYMIAFQKV